MSRARSSGEIIVDRRLRPRIRFESKAKLSFADRIFSAFTRDLTPEGAFVLADFLPPESTPIALVLEIDDGLDPIEVAGRVVHAALDSEAPAGFAIEFDGIESEDAARILAATGRS